MRCYICNRELVENVTNANQCEIHGEHIIHNGIRGKLVSNQILCKDCGSDYAKDDAAFCRIFAPFIAACRGRLIQADHGKDTVKILTGSLYDTPDKDLETAGRLVNERGGVVTPVNPYYEIEDNTITVYSEKHRIDQYINVLADQLKAEGKRITDYTIKKVTDIHDKGYLAYYFSKGNPTFNEDFKRGFVKIATEYALHCGVPREQLSEVLTINEDGKATFDCTNTKMFPFIPSALFDVLYEDYRYLYEEGYPSHSLRLFSTRYDNGTIALYCYIDLFSTFQFYVLLNSDYKGREVNETYAQRLFPKKKADVSGCDPSDLNIFIREYGIDMSQCTAPTYAEQLRYVQEYIRKNPPQAYDMQVALNKAKTKLQNAVIAVLSKNMEKVSAKHPCMLYGLQEGAFGKKALANVENILTELAKNMSLVDVMQTINSFTDSVKLEYYRKYGFSVIDGEVFNFSIPDECMKLLSNHKDIVTDYTNVKFSHLGCLCYQPDTLE